jgi:hypothetical protein
MAGTIPVADPRDRPIDRATIIPASARRKSLSAKFDHPIKFWSSCAASFSSNPIAASAITVPGGKIAAAPASYRASKSSGGIRRRRSP